MRNKDYQLRQAITKEQSKLIRKAERTGLYENFGQKEVNKLRERFIDISDYSDEMNMNRRLIAGFDKWCQSYTGGHIMSQKSL